MSDFTPRAVTINVLKGGLGKSTMTKNVAAVLSEVYDVLVMDLDDNGHLSKHLGFGDVYKGTTHFGDVVEEDSPEGFGDVIHRTEYGFDFIPSTDKIDEVKGKFNNQFSPVQVLKNELVDPLLGEVYDFILFDTPANRSLMTKNAVVASRNLMVPLAPGKQMTDGLDATINRIYNELQDLGIPVNMLALVPNMIEKRIDHQTPERELLEKINTTDGIVEWVPNFARIPEEVWDAIDEGDLDSNPKPGIRKDKYVGLEPPVTHTAPENENVEYFRELARIIQAGGVEREDGITEELLKNHGKVAP